MIDSQNDGLSRINLYPENYLEAVRLVLGDRDNRLSEESLQFILEEARGQMTPEEWILTENFFKKIGSSLKSFGKKAVKVGAKILPVVGKIAQVAAPIVGTIFGGPAGTMLGAKIGGILGKVSKIGQVAKGVGSIFGRPRPQIQQPIRQPTPRIPFNQSLNGNLQLLQRTQPAVNQLLGLIQNPAFLQSLLAQVLGGRSQGTVSMVTPNLGGKSNIPFGAFMNTLSQLSTQAAMEANGYIEDEPTYLYDDSGEFAISDPSASDARAAHVMNVLRENTYANYSFPEDNHINERDTMAEWLSKSGLLK